MSTRATLYTAMGMCFPLWVSRKLVNMTQYWYLGISQSWVTSASIVASWFSIVDVSHFQASCCLFPETICNTLYFEVFTMMHVDLLAHGHELYSFKHWSLPILQINTPMAHLGQGLYRIQSVTIHSPHFNWRRELYPWIRLIEANPVVNRWNKKFVGDKSMTWKVPILIAYCFWLVPSWGFCAALCMYPFYCP